MLMKKLVLPLFFLGLGTFVMAGCGDKVEEKNEGEKTSQTPQNQDENKLHTVAKPELNYPEPASAADESPKTPQDQFAPVVEAQPEAPEINAPAINAPAIDLPAEESQFEASPSEESAVEVPASEQPALGPSFGGEPALPAENPELPADSPVPSEEPSAESDVEPAPFDGASFEDAPTDGADFSSDPFGTEPAVQDETE
jgi:hypothetical protein